MELSITDVLAHYGATTVPSGTGWRSMRCPFHKDRIASGRVNTELNAFKCHGCTVSGDAIKIVETQENLSFKDAVEFARSVLGASIENVPRTVHKPRQRRKLGREIWKDVLA